MLCMLRAVVHETDFSRALEEATPPSGRHPKQVRMGVDVASSSARVDGGETDFQSVALPVELPGRSDQGLLAEPANDVKPRLGHAWREIPLTQGKVALVDDEDFEVLNAFKWCAYRDRYTFYAHRSMRLPGGRQKTEAMHRVILARKLGRALLKGEKTDHENGYGLDNRRNNLRLATHAQNGRNCRRRVANPSSQFLGVAWHKDTGKWVAQIVVDGKHIHLGLHSTEITAAQAREAYIVARPELQARSNFNLSQGVLDFRRCAP
jgi:hypothetical protein